MTVLLTRPEAQSRALARTLEAEGISCRIWPLTRIEPEGGSVVLPEGCDGLLFTSANAVGAFAVACPERALPVLAVGPETAAAAREAGFARTESADGDAGRLAALAARSGLRRLFHPRGRDRARDLGAELAGHGVAVTDRVLYAARPTGPPPADVAAALAAGEIGVVTVWSRRNASILSELWAKGQLGCRSGVAAVAISRQAADALDGTGLGPIFIAGRPDRVGMLDAIRRAALRR